MSFGAFALDIQKCLLDLNDLVINARRNRVVKSKDDMEIKKKLFEIIEFYSIAKELSSNSKLLISYPMQTSNQILNRPFLFTFILYCQIYKSSFEPVSPFVNWLLCSVAYKHLFCSLEFGCGKSITNSDKNSFFDRCKYAQELDILPGG